MLCQITSSVLAYTQPGGPSAPAEAPFWGISGTATCEGGFAIRPEHSREKPPGVTWAVLPPAPHSVNTRCFAQPPARHTGRGGEHGMERGWGDAGDPQRCCGAQHPQDGQSRQWERPAQVFCPRCLRSCGL